MNIPNLNLARKWRSKNFDQIIGQDLCVRILKNGLYLNSFFPVYLFSGQRGCGKTSTARVFSAAINCQKLEEFQQDAKKVSMPCLECISCTSMALGKHPDFIEIDAASNTGVDNIRNVIEASSFLPLIGRMKIYLIDEAHMLSKAAFNAFLKILEEPPATVVFILATTDVQKIIETVRSRSFQLFFTQISQDALINHLENICAKESINYNIDALQIITREAQGSVRDAINLLEQVRFSASIVDKPNVLNVLGHLSDENLLIFFDHLVNIKNLQKFLTFLDSINYNSYSAEFIWNRLLELFRISIYLKHGVTPKSVSGYKELNEIISKSNLTSIIFNLGEFCKAELIFSKAINKSLFLELTCLRIINNEFILGSKNSYDNLKNDPKIAVKIEPKLDVKTEIDNQRLQRSNGSSNALINQDLPINRSLPIMKAPINQDWGLFIDEIKKLNDPLIESVFTQSNFIEHNKSNQEIIISFAKKFIFFKELIDDSINSWLPILKKIFESNISLKIVFEEIDDSSLNISVQNIRQDLVGESRPNKVETKVKESFDFQDEQKWKMANKLMNHFPGKIVEIQEDTNE